MKTPDERPVIQIDITNACTHRCSNCTRFCGFQKKPYFMDFDYFCRAVDTLKNRKGVIGIIGGEPTLHPKFKEMCKYLNEIIPKENRVDKSELRYPTNDYIGLLNRVKLGGMELLDFGELSLMGVTGAGLWTSITPQYKRYLEDILDTFDEQFINDHNSISFHQPILISRRELEIKDDDWLEMREGCWVNRLWSGAVTPKGAFFCEVAGSLDMLFNGPGGLPLENDWWKRPIEDYEYQFHWCEMCGIPLKTYSRNANESITDVSQEMFDKIVQNDDVNYDYVKDRIHLIRINDGKIINGVDMDSYHGNEYLDDSNDRIADDSIAKAGKPVGIVLRSDNIDDDIFHSRLKTNSPFIEETIVVGNGNITHRYKNGELEIIGDRDATLGNLLEYIGKCRYIILMDDNIKLRRHYSVLEDCVINPGMLFYVNYTEKSKGISPFVTRFDGREVGRCILFSSFSNSMTEKMKRYTIDDGIFGKIRNNWHQNKIMPMTKILNRYISNKTDRDVSIRRLKNIFFFAGKYTKRHGIKGTIRLAARKISGKSGQDVIDMVRRTWKIKL